LKTGKGQIPFCPAFNRATGIQLVVLHACIGGLSSLGYRLYLLVVWQEHAGGLSPGAVGQFPALLVFTGCGVRWLTVCSSESIAISWDGLLPSSSLQQV